MDEDNGSPHRLSLANVDAIEASWTTPSIFI
jgi:hypothetical protein